MSVEKRAFFRLDVEVPYYLEQQDDSKHCLHVHKEDLLKPEEINRIHSIDRDLKELFEQPKYIDNGGVELFNEINQKLELMVWLLEQILQGGDIFENTDYHHKVELNRQLQLPETDRSSKIFPLLEAFFHRVELYIAELTDVVDRRVQGKIFMYQKESPKPFAIQHYVNGLDVAAKKGNWLASVIVMLVEKLNVYEGVYRNLKQAYKTLSNYEEWPIEAVNLAGGGFSVNLNRPYKVGDKVCSLFRLDDEFVFSRAICIYQKGSDQSELKRTAFEFEDINPEDEAHIIRFLVAQELENRN